MITADIFSMTVEELRSELTKLELSKVGNKAELQDRLLQHYGLRRGEPDSDNDNEASVSTRNVTVDGGNIFSLRDIQNSLTTFSGDGLPGIDGWLREFEDIAYTVGWNDLRKYIYARQLLKGAAKIFIRSQSAACNWSSLKKLLKEEFGTKLSAAEVHRALSGRVKSNNETLREYLYTLQEIGKPVNIDDESIIEYFVQGVKDSVTNKSILYQARTIEELKEKIKTYEKIKAAGESSNSKVLDRKGGNYFSKNHDRRCFKCCESIIHYQQM